MIVVGILPSFADPAPKTAKSAATPKPTPSVVSTQTGISSSATFPGSKDWVLGAGGGVDFPIQSLGPSYPLGYGGRLELLGSTSFLQMIAGLVMDYFHFSGEGSNGLPQIDDIRIIPTARYFLGNEDFNPYITGGAGLDIQFAATKNFNPSGFMGAGVEFRIVGLGTFFVESHYNMILLKNILNQDVPLSAGVRTGI